MILPLNSSGHGSWIQAENCIRTDCAITCRPWAEGLTYKDYAKAPEVWRRGFVSGIAAYMSAVPQPDQAPPYPVRTVLKGCLGASTDAFLVRRVEAYVAANLGLSNAPMSTVVLRAYSIVSRGLFLRQSRRPPASHRNGP